MAKNHRHRHRPKVQRHISLEAEGRPSPLRGRPKAAPLFFLSAQCVIAVADAAAGPLADADADDS